jgi:uncharacterized protein (DUF885 family)
MKRLLLYLAFIALVGAGAFIVPTVWLKPWTIDHFYARTFGRFALRHPLLLTQLGLLDGTPFDGYNGALDDLSVEAQRKEARWAEHELATLRSFDRSRMGGDQRLSAEVLDWFMADQKEGNRFLFYDYPVNQLFGVQSTLPSFMIGTHPLVRPRDADHYIQRVSRFGVAMDQIVEGLKLREKMGVVPPRFVLVKVLTEMRGFTGTPPDRNPMYVHFQESLPKIKGLDETKRKALLERLETQIRTTVDPAYTRLIEECAHLESVATTDDGVWKLPHGDEYYAHCLRSHTTTSLSADSIHALGLREVARVQAEMREILAEHGYATADLAAAIHRLEQEPRFHYPDGDSGRALIMADYQAIIDDADRRVGALFDVRPKTGVKVERVPAFKEQTSPGAYYQSGSISGSRPGAFYVNLRDPAHVTRYSMRTLAYHEAIPGHHFQITIAQELKGVPFFRKIIPFTAYDEGWGLYAERLAYEQGFQRDAYDSLGALGAELFRAARLVVDTGIHHDRWTRQQAIDYMVHEAALPEPEAVTEIERYIVSPGQACAYKVGQLEIVALRERARKALGPRFDLKKFHDVVLTNGSLPLDLLDHVVDEWIQTESRPS